ncbi:hypothetical protein YASMINEVIRUS_617 [Yasminevirus sp. GU-2018]|uniref:RING-type domain-containing protein n=1 Tax=Yasminevirus sp. GU-2018 TaxID=2420051 RepID=A0A5K0U9I7_9VIRU|nr:hypothetical protein YASMINEVIRUS_617 [Yasminevirus sp. GU-2018]
MDDTNYLNNTITTDRTVNTGYFVINISSLQGEIQSEDLNENNSDNLTDGQSWTAVSNGSNTGIRTGDESKITLNAVYYYLVVLMLVVIITLDLGVASTAIFTVKTLITNPEGVPRDDLQSEMSLDESAVVIFSSLLLARCFFWGAFLIKAYKVRKDVIHLNDFVIDDRYTRVFHKCPSLIFAIYNIILILSGNYFVATYTKSLRDECGDTGLDPELCPIIKLVTIMAYVNLSIIAVWFTVMGYNTVKQKLKKDDVTPHGVLITDLIAVTKDDTSSLTDTCPVCLDVPEPEHTAQTHKGVVTLSCSHSYHKVCINRWLSKEKTCPSCRTVVVTNDIRDLYIRLTG